MRSMKPLNRKVRPIGELDLDGVAGVRAEGVLDCFGHGAVQEAVAVVGVEHAVDVAPDGLGVDAPQHRVAREPLAAASAKTWVAMASRRSWSAALQLWPGRMRSPAEVGAARR